MGRRGPKPTPTAMLRLVGSRELSQRTDEPKPPATAPVAPTWLSLEAKAEWRRVVPHLVKLGVIAKIDRAPLVAYCESWADYHAAVRAVRVEGKTFTTPHGYIAKNPMVTILNESRAAVLRFAQEFGLTPSARARVSGQPRQADDPLTNFVNQKHA